MVSTNLDDDGLLYKVLKRHPDVDYHRKTSQFNYMDINFTHSKIIF